LESPQDPTNNSPTSAQGAEPPQPSEVDVVHALVDVEQATQKAAPDPITPDGTTPSQPGLSQPGPSRALGVFLYLSVGFTLILLLAWTVQNGVRRIGSWAASSKSNWGGSGGRRSGAISSQQAEAENLLERLAAGDSKAANEILIESDNWIGRTRRTTKANQFVNAALNQHDLLLRGAALQATLALDGVSRDGDGLNRLEHAVTDPNTRAWALWMLGALGNRGVQQERIVEILKGYLDDPDARTRSGAVYGLGTVATDETVPMLLDRFRNDASLVVQESAAASLAEAGMYTHEQRMVVAASFVGWLDDALTSPQQKVWAAHALRDISGRNLGANAAAWQQWYSGER
jgi:HEAT repeats